PPNCIWVRKPRLHFEQVRTHRTSVAQPLSNDSWDRLGDEDAEAGFASTLPSPPERLSPIADRGPALSVPDRVPLRCPVRYRGFPLPTAPWDSRPRSSAMRRNRRPLAEGPQLVRPNRPRSSCQPTC